MCAKLIVQSGIKEVVYVKEGEPNTTTNKCKIYKASQRILEAALPPKYAIYKCINIQIHNFYREKDSIEETVREVIELLMTGINKILDPTTGGTDITVKRLFQRILEAALAPEYAIYKHIKIQHTTFIGKRIPLKKQ